MVVDKPVDKESEELSNEAFGQLSDTKLVETIRTKARQTRPSLAHFGHKRES